MGILFLFSLFFFLALGHPSEYFSKDDSQRLEGLLQKGQREDGSWGSPAHTHYAISALTLLEAKVQKQKKAISFLTKSLKEASDIATIYHSVHGLDALGPFTLPSSLNEKLRRALSGNLFDIYYASQIISTLSSKNLAQMNDFDFSSALERLSELLQDDGSFALDEESEDSSAVNAGFALEVVGTIVRKAPDLAKSEAVRSITGRVKDLIESGFEESTLDFSSGSDFSALASAAIVLRGVNALASSVERKLDVSVDHINLLASFFVANRYVRDVESIYYLLNGLSIASQNAIYVPLVLSFVDSNPASLSVKVTNVIGKTVPATVVLHQASGPGGVVLRDGSFSVKNDVHYLDAAASSWNSVKPGVYILRLTVKPQSGTENLRDVTVTRHVKVTGRVTGVQAEVSVSESAKGLSSDRVLKVSHPKALEQKISATSEKYVHFKLNLATSPEFEPQQVFLQLNKNSQIAIFPVQSVGGGLFQAKLNLASTEFQETVAGGGEYKVNVIIGDALLSSAITWEIGKLDLDLPVSDKKAKEDPFQPLPEIKHLFQQPEERAASFLALLFTGLAALPLLGLLSGIKSNPTEWDFPNAGEALSGLAFQLSLAAILLLYVIYWLKLNIFQALAGLAVLGVIALITGNHALQARHKRNNPRSTKE